jgi:hypothetical protein
VTIHLAHAALCHTGARSRGRRAQGPGDRWGRPLALVGRPADRVIGTFSTWSPGPFATPWTTPSGPTRARYVAGSGGPEAHDLASGASGTAVSNQPGATAVKEHRSRLTRDFARPRRSRCAEIFSWKSARSEQRPQRAHTRHIPARGPERAFGAERGQTLVVAAQRVGDITVGLVQQPAQVRG